MPIKKEGPICDRCDQPICLDGVGKMDYDLLTAQDLRAGITEKTCYPCREEIRESRGVLN